MGGNLANQSAQPGAFGNIAQPTPAAGGDSLASGNAVQSIGNTTLYKRGDIWIAENARDVDPERDQGKFTIIDRFSDEYFQLIADNSPTENAILASQQPKQQLLVRFREECYLIR